VFSANTVFSSKAARGNSTPFSFGYAIRGPHHSQQLYIFCPMLL
jgi:hypothetical protein